MCQTSRDCRRQHVPQLEYYVDPVVRHGASKIETSDDMPHDLKTFSKTDVK